MVLSAIFLVGALFGRAPSPSDLFLVAAGQVHAASGREFRTTVWMTNLAPRRANVEATFLERHPVTGPSAVVIIELGPNETKQIDDLPLRLQRQNAVGAIRFQSAEPIAVAARIFSLEPGIAQTTGAALRAVRYDSGLARGDEGVIPGAQYDGGVNFRYTLYLAETSGRSAGMLVTIRSPAGQEIAHRSFLLEPFEQRSFRLREMLGATTVQNGSISVRVTGGAGRVYAIGLQIPTQSGDGYFVDMTAIRGGGRPQLSIAEVLLYSLTALAVIAAVLFALYSSKSDSPR